jgi:hypothetical protein
MFFQVCRSLTEVPSVFLLHHSYLLFYSHVVDQANKAWLKVQRSFTAHFRNLFLLTLKKLNTIIISFNSG